MDVLFDDACKTMPSELMLNFAYADHLESRGRPEEAVTVYKRLLTVQFFLILYILDFFLAVLTVFL
jgi:hypothetical protein